MKAVTDTMGVARSRPLSRQGRGTSNRPTPSGCECAGPCDGRYAGASRVYPCSRPAGRG